MENNYRITKLHGTFIGDNRIPDLPAGEKTKFFSSTNGKTEWVDFPDGGKNVSPCLNLVDFNGEQPTVRTSITEEELLNLRDGLYNSVIYFDASLGESGFASIGFPEPLITQRGANPNFSIFNLTLDKATNKATITGLSMYEINVAFDKNADGNYPISIRKQEEAFFGTGGGGAIETITATETSDPATEEDGFTALKLAKVPTGNQFILSYIDNADNDYFILMTKIEDGSYMGASFDSLFGSLLSYAFIDANNDGNLLCAFKSFDVSFLDEAANAEKNAGKVLVVEKQGGIGLSDIDASTMTEKFVTLVEENAAEDCPLIQKYHGIYGLYKILDGRAGAIKIDGSRSNDVIFIGYPFWHKNDVHDGYLIGSIYMGEDHPRSLDSECDYAFVGTGVYEFFNGKINITPKGCVGNMTLSGLALLAGHETASDEITTAIQNGGKSRPYYDVNLMALQYGFKETADGSAVIKTFLGYVDDTVNDKLTLSGLFNGKQGTAILEKDASGAWTSNTPIEYVGAKAIHQHTIVIKEGAKIIFAANKELESTTPATTLETLISTFKDTTTAGFGDYILLTVDTAAKLTKQDGTETDLSTLTVTISDTVK